MGDLTNKVAIVTGSGGMRGIGRAIALRFAREGADVVLVDIKRPSEQSPPDEIEARWRGIESVAAEIQALGQRSLTSYTDITHSSQVECMVAAAISELGGIDILVNNARAIIGRRDLVLNMPEDEWDRTMAVNAKGTFLCSQAISRYFVAHGKKGKIININSTSGKRGVAGRAAYCASKFAGIGFTQSLALELAPYGITVNAICPGTVDTGRFSLAEKLAAEEGGMSLKEYRRRLLEQQAKPIPLGRVAVPEDVANMAAFLASSQADYITGQAINVSGGAVMY